MRQIHCKCGHTFEISTEEESTSVHCPACNQKFRFKTEEASADSEDLKKLSIEQILLKKGWINKEQLESAIQKREEENKQGRKVLLTEVLIELGFLKPEQLKEALALQDRVLMRCPRCKKTYNVRRPSPGKRVACRACQLSLVPLESMTDVHVDDTRGELQYMPMGDAADPALVDLIPGYKMERRLGSGGMGEVYLARQKTLDRFVAVKLLHPDYSKDQAFIKRFLSEAKSAARLNHENIVRVLDAGEASGRHYFVMEYVEGETLQNYLNREGPVPEKRSMAIMRQVAQGLEHARQHNLIHRDIKPANIMLGADGMAKILDFGLSRDITSDVALTQPGHVHSSPAYASPEQCRAQRDLDHRSDMYSLGVTLFQILTGRLPFKAESSSAFFVMHVTQAPPAPQDINPSISPHMNWFVIRLLRKNPKERFATYKDLVEAIDSLGKTSPITKRRTTRLEPAGPARPKWVIPAIGAGAVLLLVVVLYFAFAGSEPPEASELPTAASEEEEFQAQLKEVRSFEKQAKGDPSQYQAVRARWKELETRYRGTPHHSRVAGPLLEFEARVESEAERAANEFIRAAELKEKEKQLAGAIRALRGFPSGYEGTKAAAVIAERKSKAEKQLELRFREEREKVWGLASSGDFEGAKKKLEEVRSLVSTERGGTREYVDPRHGEILQTLALNLKEEQLLAKRRSMEASPENPPGKADPETARTPEPPVAPPVQPPVAEKTEPVSEVKKLPVPDEASQKNAEKMIRELFGDDYGGKDSASQVALAGQLLKLAQETKSDPAGKYVLYREGRDLAAKGGDLKTAFRAIEEMCREYEGDPLSMKSSTLAFANLSISTPEAHKVAAMGWLELAEAAIEAEDFGVSEISLEAAERHARHAKSVPLAARAMVERRELTELKGNWEGMKEVRKKLETAPDDPEANLALGRFLCFVKGDWKRGLPMIKKGDDAALGQLAARDLASSGDPRTSASLCDAWFELYESESGLITKRRYLERARHWYEAAGTEAQKSMRDAIRRRFGAVPRSSQPAAEKPLAVARVGPIPVVRGLIGAWDFEEGRGTRVADRSTSGKHGELKNFGSDSGWVKGSPSGKSCLSFDGEDNYVIIDGDGPWASLTREVTAAAWIQKGKDQIAYRSVVARQAGSGKADHFYLGFFDNQLIGFVQTGFQEGPPINNKVLDPQPYPQGRWIHIAVVYNGSNLRLYRDGKQVAFLSVSGSFRKDTNPVMIGADRNHEIIRDNFAGRIARVRIYNRALSANEIFLLASRDR